MKPLPEDQIRVQRIDDDHVAVSAYEHLGYRHWVKVALSDPPKIKPDPFSGTKIYEQLTSFDKAMVNAWLNAERKQRDDRMLRILAAVITANTSGDGEFQQRADAWHDALKKYLTP